MRKVDSYGPLDAKIMVVGEAPGSTEEASGRPFVGPAGGVLRELLLKSGIDPEEVRYSNLCRYRPSGNDFTTLLDQGRPGSLLLEGLSELSDEVEQVDPNVIVALGNYPLQYLTGKRGISDWRGSILAGNGIAGGRKVIPSYHPSYLLRGATRDKPIVRFDLQRAKAQSGFKDIRRPAKTIYKVENEEVMVLGADGQWEWTDATAWGIRNALVQSKMISFDIEYTSHLLCIGMTCSADWAVCFVTKTQGDTDRCKEVLHSGVPLCAQNAMFDCSMLDWHEGFDVVKRVKFDTMIAAYVMNIEYPKSLDFLCSMYTEQPYYKDMVHWKDIIAGKQPKTDVWHYNAIDTWVTHAIYEQQQIELDSDPKFREAFEFDMAKLPALWEVSRRGVLVDRSRLAALEVELRDKATSDLIILESINDAPLNVKSGPQVRDLLFKKLHIPAGRKTPTGGDATDDTTLADCYIKCTTDLQRAAIEYIRSARENLDLISKFCNIELDTDGRMRCHYDPAKTETRRLSSRKFYPTGRGTNLQNIPRDSRVRSVFVPDRGLEFAYADLKAAEFLVVAELTQDVTMLDLARMAVDGTGDVHKITAAYLLSKPIEEITKDDRFLGKKARHACNYMLGWKKFMEYVNSEANKTGVTITAAVSKVIIERYRGLHPGLARWWRDTEYELRQTRTLRNCFGFRRTFNDSIDAILPNAIAFKPQSTIGDALNFGLLNCANDYELQQAGMQILLQVHDAIGYQYPPENRDFINSRVPKLLSVPIPIPNTGRDLLIPVDVKFGPSWGEAEG